MTNPMPVLRRPDAHAGALDEQLARSLRQIAFVLAGMYLLATVHALVEPLPASTVSTAVVPMVVFLLVALLPSWRTLPFQLANPVLVLGMALIAAEAIGQGRAGGGAHLGWALIGLGAVVLRPRWGMAAAAAVLVPWLAVSLAGVGGWSLARPGDALDILTAGAIGTVVFAARRRSVLGLVAARLDLSQLALTDPLTALRNRRGLETAAAGLLAAFPDARLQIVYLDLDGFKAVNDRLGHAEGDRALRAVADILRATFRAADVIGRVGGDEFLVIVTPGSDADAAAGRLQDQLAAWRDEAGRIILRASVGVCDVKGTTIEAFWAGVESADRRMYADKVARRGFRRVLPAAEPATTAGSGTAFPMAPALG
jgi:diguanylate cyclase (GGDEF)-like protein